MAHGKDAARDVRYGRRGGRWASEGAGTDRAADVHQLRLRELAKGPGVGHWPRESLQLWQDIAAQPEHPQHAKALEVLDVARRHGWLEPTL